MLKIAALEKLIHELNRLPGIGPKTAQRFAYYILKSPANYTQDLVQALAEVKAKVHECKECFNYTDKEVCYYCEDPYRSNEVLCVVEEPSDIDRIESSGAYRGRYHVLHGSLSPLDGVGPKDLKIEELLARIHSPEKGTIREVILALDADLEGDTTVLYIAKHLQGAGVKVSRIAHGIPIGSNIDFIDDRTMSKALENRVDL